MRKHIFILLTTCVFAVIALAGLYSWHDAFSPSEGKANMRYFLGAIHAFMECDQESKKMQFYELADKYKPKNSGVTYLEAVEALKEKCKTTGFLKELERLNIARNEYISEIDQKRSASLKETLIVWGVLIVIFYGFLHLGYLIVKWIKNKLYPDLSEYVEICTVNGHGAVAIKHKLSKKSISVYIDDSKHPLPCRILVPINLRERALEILGRKNA